MRTWLRVIVGAFATGAQLYFACYGPTSLFVGALALMAWMIWLLGTEHR